MYILTKAWNDEECSVETLTQAGTAFYAQQNVTSQPKSFRTKLLHKRCRALRLESNWDVLFGLLDSSAKDGIQILLDEPAKHALPENMETLTNFATSIITDVFSGVLVLSKRPGEVTPDKELDHEAIKSMTPQEAKDHKSAVGNHNEDLKQRRLNDTIADAHACVSKLVSCKCCLSEALHSEVVCLHKLTSFLLSCVETPGAVWNRSSVDSIAWSLSKLTTEKKSILYRPMSLFTTGCAIAERVRMFSDQILKDVQCDDELKQAEVLYKEISEAKTLFDPDAKEKDGSPKTVMTLQAINWAPIIDIEYDMCDYILDYVFIM